MEENTITDQLKKLSLSEKISAFYFAIRIRLGFAKSGSLTAFEFLFGAKYHKNEQTRFGFAFRPSGLCWQWSCY